jgi:hypothetical protein
LVPVRAHRKHRAMLVAAGLTLKLTCRGRLQERDAARNQSSGPGQVQRRARLNPTGATFCLASKHSRSFGCPLWP